MAQNKSRGNGWLLACGMAAVCLGAVPSFAAPPDEQVTVQDTPYTIHREVIEPSIGNMSKMTLRATSVSRGVTYSDLDLSRDSDVVILKSRAKKAAWDVCRQADHRAGSPLYRPVGVEPDCVANAKQQALADVNRLVAQSRAGRTVAAN